MGYWSRVGVHAGCCLAALFAPLPEYLCGICQNALSCLKACSRAARTRNLHAFGRMRSTLVVLLLGDPHLLEGGEGRQDGSSDPDGVLPLRGSNDLDLDGGGSKGSAH